MKQSSLLALIGVVLLLLNCLFYIIANACESWQYDWYRAAGHIWDVIHVIAWILIGQFFLTLYKKTK